MQKIHKLFQENPNLKWAPASMIFWLVTAAITWFKFQEPIMVIIALLIGVMWTITAVVLATSPYPWTKYQMLYICFWYTLAGMLWEKHPELILPVTTFAATVWLGAAWLQVTKGDAEAPKKFWTALLQGKAWERAIFVPFYFAVIFLTIGVYYSRLGIDHALLLTMLGLMGFAGFIASTIIQKTHYKLCLKHNRYSLFWAARRTQAHTLSLFFKKYPEVVHGLMFHTVAIFVGIFALYLGVTDDMKGFNFFMSLSAAMISIGLALYAWAWKLKGYWQRATSWFEWNISKPANTWWENISTWQQLALPTLISFLFALAFWFIPGQWSDLFMVAALLVFVMYAGALVIYLGAKAILWIIKRAWSWVSTRLNA